MEFLPFVKFDEEEDEEEEKRRAGASNGQRHPLPCCTKSKANPDHWLRIKQLSSNEEASRGLSSNQDILNPVDSEVQSRPVNGQPAEVTN